MSLDDEIDKTESGEKLRMKNKVDIVIENRAAHESHIAGKMPDDYQKLGWDDTNRSITQMGIFRWRPRFLEVFNTPSSFTIIFSLSNFFMVMSYSILSIILPTLESLFNLTSTQTGFILMANDISGTVAAVIMANYCSARKTRWISIGMLIVVVSSLVPASTTLFVEYPQPNINAGVQVVSTRFNALNHSAAFEGKCNETLAATDHESEGVYAEHNHKYYSLFILGALLQGIGGTPPGIAGSTYMDEIFTQKQFGIAISVLYVVSFLGYPISMLVGSKFLTYYVTLESPPEGVTMESKEWVGAWWICMVVPSIVVFILSFCIALFPRQMPAAKIVLEDKVKRGFTTVLEKKEELNRSLKEITKDMIPSYKRILKNKAVVYLMIGDIFLFLHYGAFTFYPKIYSLLFRLDPKEVGSILGYGNIIGFVFGMVGGALVTRWKNWTVKTLQMIYSILSLVALPFLCAILLYCPVNTYAGVDVHYFPDNSSQISPIEMTATCNSECSCTTAFYQPVCDGHVTYFSPCHAGCQSVSTDLIDNQTVIEYQDCLCTESSTAAHGGCGGPCEKKLWIAMVIYVIGIGLSFAGFSAHAIVYQRIVAEVDRTAVQGVRQSVTRILGTLPSPLIFGYLLDSTCSVWRTTKSGERGNCWIYDLDTFIYWFLSLQLIFRIFSCVFCWLCWWNLSEIAELAYNDEVGMEKIPENGNDCSKYDDKNNGDNNSCNSKISDSDELIR